MQEHFSENVNVDLEFSVDKLHFFMIIVLVEHSMIILKIIMEKVIDDTPAEIYRSENTRQGYIKRYVNMSQKMKEKKVEHDFEDVTEIHKAVVQVK